MKRRAAVIAVALLALAATPPETIDHVVEAGETLSSIAARSDIYADPMLWPLIYKFNRDQIVDPQRIYPGQRLQIPIRVDEPTRRATRIEAGAARSAEAGAVRSVDAGAARGLEGGDARVERGDVGIEETP